jgi:hypothetical protein
MEQSSTIEMNREARVSRLPTLKPGKLLVLLGRLERRWARRAVIGFALLLVAPTLAAGYALDDYLLLDEMARPTNSEWPGRAPFDLFRWMDPAHDQRLIDGAGMPWWTFDGALCAFMRPLSSLSHALDHALWPHSAWLMHLHNVAWFALLLGLVGMLYADLVDTRLGAALALAMFAFDSAHGEAVGWISNRNALICGALGAAALLLHHRSRERRVLAPLAWSCFGLSLASAELAAGLPGYLIAYALFYDRAPARERVRSLAPYALLFVVWAGLRKLGHYGSFGLGAYVDPIGEPLSFLRLLPARFLVLLASQTGRLSSDWFDLVPLRIVPWLVLGAAAISVLGAWFIWPSLVRRASTRFWATGVALSILPLAATVPADRLLMLAGIGVMPVLAQASTDVLAAYSGRGQSLEARWLGLRRLCAGFLIVLHLGLEPLLLPYMALSTALVDHWARGADASLPIDPALADKTVIVAALPDSVLLSYLPAMRALNGRARPEHLYWLDAIPGNTRLERIGPRTLRVSAPAGLFDRRSEARSKQFAFQPGDKITLSEMTIEVLELTKNGIPSVCRFEFAKPLESSTYVWETWAQGKLQPFTPPAEGTTANLTTS